MVPRNSTAPSGNGWWRFTSCPARSAGVREISVIEMVSSSRKPSVPSTSSRTSTAPASSSPKFSSKSRMNGPIAQLALLSLARPSSSADRPSKSRRLTSLPSVAPCTLPSEAMTRTTSGSGLFHAESGCTPMSAPVPTAAIGCAFVNSSASGPSPTSRYGDQRLRALRCCLSSAASGLPGRTSAMLDPRMPVISARAVSARAGSPRACSSITRSSMLRTKVTPEALIAWRSTGASSLGRSSLPAAVAVRQSSRSAIRSPDAARSAAAGSGSSIRSRMVAQLLVTSTTPPGSRRTTLGPATSGRQMRPANVPWPKSSGRTSAAVKRAISLSFRAVFPRTAGGSPRPARNVPRRRCRWSPAGQIGLPG